MQILKDTEFACGFGAEWSYGKSYSIDSSQKKGFVTDYQKIPFPIYLIPYGTTDEYSEDEIYWAFEEGYHEKFTDRFGQYVERLYQHELCINHKIITNSPDCLEFVQYNNYGLAKDDPLYDTRLVKRIKTDKKGTVSVYYDNANDIRNAAYAFSPQFGRDTWPHLLLHQNLKESVDISLFESIYVSFNMHILSCKQMSLWPDDGTVTKPYSLPVGAVNAFFYIKEKGGGSSMFAGHNIFATNKTVQNRFIGLDQYGTVFYRETTEEYGGIPQIGDRVTVRYELRSLIKRALAEASARDPRFRNKTPDDYTIEFFQTGWENMGVWRGEFVLSGLSCEGKPKT